MMNARMLTLSILLLAGLPGCSRPSPDPLAFQRQHVSAVSYEAAFDAAERALGERFRIARRDPDRGLLRSAPAETHQPIRSGHAVRDALGGAPRARRIAEVHVRPANSDIDVLCQVLVQQSETAAARTLSRDRGAYDQPTETPADAEAGTTIEQNTVWVTRSRDREMERQILASIREILAKAGG